MTDTAHDAAVALKKRHLLEALGAAAGLLQAQRFQEGAQVARAILEAHPGQPEALHVLGLCARGRGDLGEAGEYLLQAVRTQQRHAPYHASLGLVFLEQGLLQEAERALGVALQLDAHLVAARYNRANLYLQTGRRRQAIEEFEAVLAADDTNAGAHHNLALALMGTGAREQAQEHLHKACLHAPNSATPWQTQARWDADEGRLLAALEALDHALENQPEVGEPYLLRAQIQQALGRFDTAEEDLRIFIEMNPRDPFLAAQALQGLPVGASFPDADWLHYAELWREKHALPQLRQQGSAGPSPAVAGSEPGSGLRLRLAFLAVSGNGPAGWLPPLLQALLTRDVDVDLWCARPPESVPPGLRVHALDRRDPTEIAERLREPQYDALIQIGGLQTPELLLAALHRPAPRVLVWASHPRLGFPEIDFWLEHDADPGTPERFLERTLQVPAGAWPDAGAVTTPLSAAASGLLVAPEAPATLNPHRLALLHRLARHSGRTVVLSHPDFELDDICEALRVRWEALGPDSKVVLGGHPGAASLWIATGMEAPDAGLRNALANGIPVLPLNPLGDPLARAAWAHLWARCPEVLGVPGYAAPEAAQGQWADAVGAWLDDDAKWSAVSETARAPAGPSLVQGLANHLLETLAARAQPAAG